MPKVCAGRTNPCIIYTVSTQQHQYSNTMYAIGYTVATCFDRKHTLYYYSDVYLSN